MLSVKVLGNFIDGEFVRPPGAEIKIVSKDPGDSGYQIGNFPVYADHVHRAVESARKAFNPWRHIDSGARVDMLRKFIAEVVNHRQELIELISAETGKPLWESEEEVAEVEARVEIEIREGVRSVTPFRVGEIRYGVEGSCDFRPVGVVAVLGPAISPVHLAVNHIVPALLAGNTVVYKPSKLVPATGQYIANLFAEIDLPRGVFNFIQGDAAIGSALAAHENVDAVLFTGSYPAGKRILQATADQPHKLVALQMGGVNVALIMEKADVQRALYETVKGAFLTAGQRYASTGVILVQKEIFSRYTEGFVDIVQSLNVGYAFDPDVFMGPVLSETARDRFMERQERLAKSGARFLLSCRPLKRKRPGYYLSPAVCVVEHAEELDQLRPYGLSFGPDVILIPIDGLVDGIQLANSTSFPFCASVFDEAPENFKRCAEDLRFGVLNHNVATTFSSMRLPLGGIRKCGNHRPGGLFAQRNCTYPVASLRATTPFDPDRTNPHFLRDQFTENTTS